MSGLAEPRQEDLANLAARLGPGAVVDGRSPEAARYLVEPRGRWRGRAAAILRPGTTAEVAEIVRLAARHRFALVPYGGGTGLVGGQVRPEPPPALVVSLERMNRIRAVLPEDDALVAEAGAVLAEVKASAAAAGRLFPLSLASEGSCTIGGNLATNAGGVQVLRYGNARALCLGVEAVLADGAVMSELRPLRKDNTGYDLRDLLIGSEGTLGIITAATLRLFPLPGETVTAMLAVPSPAAALALLHAVRERLGETISAFELISGTGVAFVAAVHPDRRDPLGGAPDWRVLLEAAGPTGGGLRERAEEALAAALEKGLAEDGVIAASEAQRAAMWWLRETIPEANRRIGAVASHDVALPLARLAEFIERAGAAVAAIHAGLRVNCFGHVGDGNLHYNVFPPAGRRAAEFRELAPRVTRAVHDLVHALGGSISAEHGIGRLKVNDLARYADPARLAAMRRLKRALDPLGIMNPGAVLSADAPAAAGNDRPRPAG